MVLMPMAVPVVMVVMRGLLVVVLRGWPVLTGRRAVVMAGPVGTAARAVLVVRVGMAVSVVSLVVVLWRGLRVTGVRVGPVGPVVMVPLVVRVLTRRCWGMAAVVVPGVTGVLGVPGVPVV